MVDPPSHKRGRQLGKFTSGSPSTCSVGRRQCKWSELGSLGPGRGGGHALQAHGAQQRGLWDRKAGKSAWPPGLLARGVGMV